MLRVGLTGGLGSGKSAVALVWAAEGVPVLHADELGRALMRPGEVVHTAILEHFGPAVTLPSGELDRVALAREAFENSRLSELNSLVHPAVISAQERALQTLAAAGHPLAAVESALIFEASGEHAPGWRERFDKLVLVSAPESTRIERFVTRAAAPDASEAERHRLREDARRRIAAQMSDSAKRPFCDYILENNRSLVLLRREALRALAALRRDAEAAATPA